ncbi:beta galactosidase [Powellomyces hirtus]|nr:beta galactosidase [Powellomyces hirtus]
MAFKALLISGLLLLSLAVSWFPAEAAPGRVTFDKYSLKIDGKRISLYSGEVHPWRLPSSDLWRDVLQKMKAAGFNGVQIYIHWGYHSIKPGEYDFTGVRDMDKFFTIAKEVGIYVIARAGPYINAETTGGGLPGWLGHRISTPGRSDGTDYAKYWMEWFSAVDPIIAKHQIHRGGSVILVQIENEYSGPVTNATTAHMVALKAKVRADGITVPTTHNDWFKAASIAAFHVPHMWNLGVWADGPGAVDIYAWDGYPNGFDCSNPEKWSNSQPDSYFTRRQSHSPLFIAEYQGGSFDPWGGLGFEKCRTLTNANFERDNIGAGVTMQNFYMTFGGTNWGHLATPSVYSSYDFHHGYLSDVDMSKDGAAISESLSLTTKYSEQKLIAYFLQASPDIAKTDYLESRSSNAKVRIRALVNPDTCAQFRVVKHEWGPEELISDVWIESGNNTFGLPPRIPVEDKIVLPGRDAQILVANYGFASEQSIVYATLEVLTHATFGGTDYLFMYGNQWQPYELVLRTAGSGNVTVERISAANPTSFKSTIENETVRLNSWIPKGINVISVKGAGGKPLILIVADRDTAYTFWRTETPQGPVIVRGGYLLRGATVASSGVRLSLDISASSQVEVFGPQRRNLHINDVQVSKESTPWGSVITTREIRGPAAIKLPSLRWQTMRESPEINPAFDDSTWMTANKTKTLNPVQPPAGAPVLYADDYGFHKGHILYRGQFTSNGKNESGISIRAQGGEKFVYAVWLNGAYLGYSWASDIDHGWKFPTDTVAESNITIICDHMGLDQAGGGPSNEFKNYRGLHSASLKGSSAKVIWKIQGNAGGEDLLDKVRGPYNVGGLYGERKGWHLPGFPSAGWKDVSLPHKFDQPGVSWYRTKFAVPLPQKVYAPISLRFTQEINASPSMRAQIYINGWQFGRYVSALGPQTEYPLPAGILRSGGQNTLAIVVWGLENSGNELGNVELIIGGVPVVTSLTVADVPGSNWSTEVYDPAPSA